MTYRDYVIAAYAVFAIVLLWDAIAPQLLIRTALRAAKRRIARTSTRNASTELHR